MYPRQKCSAAGVKGGVGRCISAVELVWKDDGLRRREAK
jgi:hypothetical protein